MIRAGGVEMKWISFILVLLTILALMIPLKKEPLEVPSDTTEVRQSDWQIPIRFAAGIRKMDLEEYLVGAVYGEMPIWFEAEALKAQAVAARTFALKAYTTGGKHGDGSVCTDPGCCQAYRLPDEQSWAVRQAVYKTAGQALCYEKELIDAVYFSCSGGSTEDAAAVWGQEVPYLRAVDSPGEEEAEVYCREIHFDRQELEQKLDVALPDTPGTWFQNISYTLGGGIETVQIGGRYWTGGELRRLLSLPSTRFSVLPEQNGVLLRLYGYGHRVGMSQFGADAMAAGGADYQEILKHYYTGTEILELHN